MPELYPDAGVINALSGTSDSQQEVYFPPIGESPYYTSFYKMLLRLLNVCRRAGDLRVFKDGDLTFGVRAGSFMDGSAIRDYPGAAGQPLTSDAANFIFLTTDGTLTVNTTAFPDPSVTPHIPLASIAAAGGQYDFADIVDYRGRALVRPVDGLSPELANSVRAGLSKLTITAGGEANDARLVTVQVCDATGALLAQRFRLRVWVSNAEYGPASSAGNSVAITSGTMASQIGANSDYELITGLPGNAAFNLTVVGAATRFVMAEMDGHVYSSGALTWA